MRVALFVTCLADTLFPDVGRATVTLLERLGHEVVFPEDQTCCGQMHVNSGYRQQALPLVRRFVRAFEEAGADAIVCPSGSCAALVRRHYPELAAETGDDAVARSAAALAPRVFELSQFLVDELGVEDVGARYPFRVAYHPTCHSLRLLRVGEAPLRLLRAVAGIELVEIADAQGCCGFGGTFALKNAETSSAMMEDKLAALTAAGAQACTALDSSCLMHLRGGIERQGLPIATPHLAEILASVA
ncbi:MAG TPA: (Fe-S)-binding protein [Baekduia sp.]|uniref:(Fe-S)-binding protein n=1 Tax=Baekduia sp. TaxID=2600305 RepID=UPI002D79A979|nr:(Fe-S)-binding protein [Baekduia sp.]HET6507871.1 (Fe-S)-binding protein [Baekduia sp.]